MDLSTLTPGPGAHKKRKRVGRGPASGNGKTCGRGHKGQKSRSGYSNRAGFEGGQLPLARRFPKRGFTQVPRHPFAQVNLDLLNHNFESGEQVTKETLLAKHLIKDLKGGIKVLGRGDITKKLIIKADSVSEGARAKIEGAGGSIELIPVAPSRAIKPPRRRKGTAKEA